MFVLYIPIVDQHDLLIRCVNHVNASVKNRDDFVCLVVDNDSDPPYTPDMFSVDINLQILRNDINRGACHAIVQAYDWLMAHSDHTTTDILGMIHSDVFIYEHGWDERVREAFAADPQLGLIGFCGSNEVDRHGGRGSGTVCNFDGRAGQSQEITGRRITDLRPAAILDGLSMIFRASMIPTLQVNDRETPFFHFYDKIWSMKVLDSGKRVATLGILIDHIGGATVNRSDKYRQAAAEWCRQNGVPFDPSDPINSDLAVYKEAERRMFREFAPRGLIPCTVDANYNLHRVYGAAIYPPGV